MTMVRAKTPTEHAVDNFTSSVESLLIALSQRPMSEAQIFRLGRILEEGREHLLRRTSTSCAVRARRNARVRDSGGSRKDRAA